jgi:Domain of unknown function (DUF4340)
MKLRSLILSTVVLLALVGTLYWSEHRKPKEDTTVSADTSPSILKLDDASITQVDLKKKDAAPIVLAQNSSGTWQITEPKQLNADQNTVSSMVSTLSSLRSERVVDDKPSDLSAYGLTRPALEVDLTEKDNKHQKLLIGDDTPTGSSVYAMLTGDPRVFTIATYNKTSFDKSVDDLRDKRLLAVAGDKISRLDLVRNNQTIEFGRDKEEWQILKPKPLPADTVQVGELVQKLTDARMDISGSAASAKDAASAFAHGTPVAIAKVTDLSGTQELQVRKDKDAYYAKSSMVEGAYKVDSSLGQAMDKGLDDFRNKKVFAFGFSDPDKIEMHNGSKAVFLSRSGADWWSNGKKMDAISAEDFVSALRDLSASKLVDSGFTSPAIEITVTSDKGKKVDKVSIAKSGSDFVAMRESDPTLYQLDGNAVDSLQKSADNIKPDTGAKK